MTEKSWEERGKPFNAGVSKGKHPLIEQDLRLFKAVVYYVGTFQQHCEVWLPIHNATQYHAKDLFFLSEAEIL